MVDVGALLKVLGLGQYAKAFADNDVDAETLAKLTVEDLKEIGVKSVGHRRKLLDAITRLGQDNKKSGAFMNVGAAFASPDAYTPQHLADQILQSRSVIRGERKQVTVLFADIKGSLELIENSDPEDAHAIFDQAIRTMMESVHRYEGTVNKVLGDGIMALFGAPIAHEDHAVRACYAALAMQDAIRRRTEEVRRSHGVELQVRVGLNSGEVVVRAIGNDLALADRVAHLHQRTLVDAGVLVRALEFLQRVDVDARLTGFDIADGADHDTGRVHLVDDTAALGSNRSAGIARHGFFHAGADPRCLCLY